jgi:hypothetical protein
MPLSEGVTKYCDNHRGVKKQGDVGKQHTCFCLLGSICKKSPSYPLTWELLTAWENKMNSEYELLKERGDIK